MESNKMPCIAILASFNRSVVVNTVLGYNSDDRQPILDRGRKGKLVGNANFIPY